MPHATALCRRADLGTVLLQVGLHQMADLRVVIHDQDVILMAVHDCFLTPVICAREGEL
jgi:hypothetical protein